MKSAGSESGPRADEPLWEGFLASAPLLGVSAAFFVAAFVASNDRLTFAGGRFPLAGLLVGLGFIAAIGAVLSWFFAGGSEPERDSAAPIVADRTNRLPEGWEGRPRPDVRIDQSTPASRPTAEPAPWDEGPVDTPVRLHRIADPATLQAEVRHTLQELERLQSEVGPRRVPKGDSRQ